MKKRTKIIIGICITILIIITGVIGYAGNYFYTLAIDSTSDKSVVFGSSENDSVAEKAKSEAEAAFMKHGKDRWLTNQDGYRLHAYEAS